MIVIVARQATQDLQDLYDFISRDNPKAADRTLTRIGESFSLLSSGLGIGREVVLKDGRRVRAWSVPPYRIYYRINNDALQIVRVYHQARRSIEK